MELTHRGLAVQTYNAAWRLLEQQRTGADDRELLGLALTSRHHWAEAGGPQEAAVADWMVSRCCAALGEGRLALSYGLAALERAEDGFPFWLRASLHEGVARAAAAAGDARLRDEHLAAARALLAQEPDEEDRAVVQGQVDEVPTS